ncbi:MAG TPA: zinc-ribbon domain-containing protein [Firmicutes bacterium]|nr:zinc-ribbon domain-containing protein [Bacillota bacterium]
MKYLCPSCGALNEEDAAFCTGCGMALRADAQQRRQQIERRLRGEEPPIGQPVSPPAAPRPEELTGFESLPAPAAEEAVPVPAEGERPSAPPLRRKRRRGLWIGGVAALILAVAAVSTGLAVSRYNAAPERVIEKLEMAINTQDADLFWSVGDTESFLESYSLSDELPDPVWKTVPCHAEFRVIDVLEGKHHRYATGFVEWMVVEDDGQPLEWDENSPYYGTTALQFIRQDGRWLVDNYFLFVLLNVPAQNARYDLLI